MVHRGGGSQPGEPVLGAQSCEQLYWQTRAKVLLAKARLSWRERAAFLFAACVLKPLAGLCLAPRARWWAPYWRGLRDGWRA